MLLGTLGASLLENVLSGKGLVRGGDGVFRVGEEEIELVRIFSAA